MTRHAHITLELVTGGLSPIYGSIDGAELLPVAIRGASYELDDLDWTDLGLDQLRFELEHGGLVAFEQDGRLVLQANQ